MAIPPSTRARLATQLDGLDTFLDGLNARFAEIPPGNGGWSAKENVAHLARHAHIFLERLERILREDRPDLGDLPSRGGPGVAGVAQAAAR